MPLEAQTGDMDEEVIEIPSADEMKEIRAAILIVKHASRDINFEGDIIQNIEIEYVNDRKTKSQYGQEHLKLILSLTKYICILEGTGKPTMEDFQKAKELVFEMMRRNESRYPLTAPKDSNPK